MHGVYRALGHQWWKVMDGLGSLIEGDRMKGNGERSSPATCRARAKGHLLEYSGVGIFQVVFILEMLGDEVGEAWG